MPQLMRVPLEDGQFVLVELSENDPGVRRVSRVGETITATMTSMEAALEPIQSAARSALETFRKIGPDEVEIEFGVKLNAEAGALITKAGAEGHLVVKLAWRGSAQEQE
ncbi:CU044_2847 family protein [Nonomuraea africana]|uniref:Trypsin-co-occurring domain-containing protein n=1 Tax=Nonomuraea africana TaxID=46171 RepID=A0ABR9KRT7_9ACTN|nr:CU044_2847 family protein [Nonomuraea africana]MBE1564743.1 hypothetical protein [Nonomuraea africana]